MRIRGGLSPRGLMYLTAPSDDVVSGGGSTGGDAPVAASEENAAGEGGDRGFPANTPIAEMTAEQQAAYWKHQSRKHEANAKAATARLESMSDYEDLKKAAADAAEASKTEHEKALEAAKAEGAAEAEARYKRELVQAAIRTHLAKHEMRLKATGADGEVVVDANILDVFDVEKLWSDGQVDSEKIATIFQTLMPAVEDTPRHGDDPFMQIVSRQTEGGKAGDSFADLEAAYAAKHKDRF